MYNEIMKSGFTIIELLIVITVISVITGAGYISYSRSSQRYNLEKDAENLGSNLSLAKQRTLSRDLTPLPGCTVFRGYEIQFITATTYRIRFICRPGAADQFTNASPVYTLGPNNVFNSVPATNRSAFFVPYGCIDPTFPNSICGTAATNTMQLRNRVNSSCISVTVNNLGVVTVGDAAPCP